MRMWDLKFEIKELGQKATCEIIQEKYIVEKELWQKATCEIIQEKYIVEVVNNG